LTGADPYAVIARALRSQAGERESGEIHSYAALGDSFTAGTGCPPGEPWADRLAGTLRALSPGLTYCNFAVEGARSSEVLDQLGPALQLEPDLVTVVCGVNDVLFSVRPDAAAYARNLTGIVRRLRAALPAVRILTATAPEQWAFLELGPRTRARLERGTRRFNSITRGIARSHGLGCLEVADHPGLAEPENFVADGLHPSADGHRQAAAGFARLLGVHEPQTRGGNA
jgi:lysophospholipase L1-like esterase